LYSIRSLFLSHVETREDSTALATAGAEEFWLFWGYVYLILWQTIAVISELQ